MQIEQLPCSLRRRFGAMFYDTLLLLSVLIFATILVLPITGGEAVATENVWYKAYLFFICLLYFCVPWVIRSQTLGMQTWKIKVLKSDGEKIGWWQGVKRFSLSILSWLPAGLGFFWALKDAERETWHDRLSDSSLVYFKPIKK